MVAGKYLITEYLNTIKLMNGWFCYYLFPLSRADEQCSQTLALAWSICLHCMCCNNSCPKCPWNQAAYQAKIHCHNSVKQEMVRQLIKECEFQIEFINALIPENIYGPAFLIFFILHIILLSKSLKQWFILLFTSNYLAN